MKKFSIWVLLPLLVLAGCKHKQKKESIDNLIDTMHIKATDTELTKGVDITHKTVKIDSPSVIFFMPDYKERSEIIRFYGTYNQFDFEQIFSNFRRLALDASQALVKQHIKSYLTFASQFDIKTDSGYIHFDRKAQNEIVGFIIADGHKAPLIKFGVYKYLELEKLIKDYFNITNFNMLNQPQNYNTSAMPNKLKAH